MDLIKRQKKNGLMLRFIQGVEKAGNKLPHPMYIFIWLLLGCMVISAVCAALGVEVTYLSAASDGTVSEVTVAVRNLLGRSELQNFFSNVVTAYKNMGVMIPMLIVSFCISIADEVGFFEVALRRILRGAPQKVIVFALCLACICANIAGDAGVVLAISFGSILFKAMGRNPWIGVTLAYGSLQAGYCVNLLPTTNDITYAGITDGIVKPLGYTVHAMSNYIFMFIVAWLLALAFTFVCEKFLVPLFGDSTWSKAQTNPDSPQNVFELSAEESRGLKFAGIGAGIYLLILVLWLLPIQGMPVLGFLRSPENKLFPTSPLLNSMIPLIGLLFLVTSIPFGIGAGKIKSKADIPPMMQKGAVKVAGFVFVLFWCSLFIYQFNYSNLATVLSKLGEQFLTSIHLTGLPLLIVYILIVAVINIFMYSSSAKWMILAPVFLPMFINLGIDPVMTQLATRIADACTNGLTPLNAGLVLVLATMRQDYDPKFHSETPGLGSVISAQLPISVASFLVQTVLFIVFYLFKIPFGIG